jgi:hypothetical protein
MYSKMASSTGGMMAQADGQRRAQADASIR